jgi:fatty-acyl-CoA synthase
MLEAHNAVPMAHAVLCPINTRLDAPTVRFILGHSGAKILLLDREFAALVNTALEGAENPPRVIIIDDPEGPGGAEIDATPYEDFIAGGDPGFPIRPAPRAIPRALWCIIAVLTSMPAAMRFPSG